MNTSKNEKNLKRRKFSVASDAGFKFESQSIIFNNSSNDPQLNFIKKLKNSRFTNVNNTPKQVPERKTNENALTTFNNSPMFGANVLYDEYHENLKSIDDQF